MLWYTQLHPEDRERWHAEFARTCAAGEQFRSEYRFLARDGRVVWVHGEAQVVRDEAGQPLFLQGIAYDITEKKQVEEVLRRINLELERRVQDRTAQLEKANAAGPPGGSWSAPTPSSSSSPTSPRTTCKSRSAW